jgi:hypothetical protein
MGTLYLVVRIVKSTSLFENEDGTVNKAEEEYAELRSQRGEINFIAFTEIEEPFLTKRSTIRALPCFPWRVKK